MTWFVVAISCVTVAVWVAVALTVYVRSDKSTTRATAWFWPTALVLLVNIGSLHATAAFAPVDGFFPQLLIGSLILVTAHLALSQRIGLDASALICLGLFLLGAVHPPTTEYGRDKMTGLALTALVVVMASILLRDQAHRRGFLWGTVLVGLLVFALSVVSPATEVAAGRIAAEGATTIATGRMAGSALVVVLALLVARRVSLVVAAPITLALTVLMFETGSRGPLVAAAVAIGLLLILSFAKRPARAVVITVAAVGFAWYAWDRASALSRERMQILFSDDRGRSVSQREYMWGKSWDIATHAPPWEWRGWGNLNRSDLAYDQFPHNMFLEVWVEAGLLGAALLLALFVGAFRRTYLARTVDSTALPLLALLAFSILNAMVSGELNDRPLFAVIVACWACGLRADHSDAVGPQVVDEGLHALSKLGGGDGARVERGPGGRAGSLSPPGAAHG